MAEKDVRTYAEKLKDPRWQKMRLEIMQRDGFACAMCKDATTTLNVHHKYYTFGANPWDYSPLALVTLCEMCHQAEEWNKASYNKTLKDVLENGHYYEQIEWVLSTLNFHRAAMPPFDLASLIARFLVDKDSLAIMEGLLDKRSKEFGESLND